MDFREKAALILLAVILYATVCSKCMPQCLRDSPFVRYINKQKYSPNIPTTQEKGRKTYKFQDDLIKQNKLYSKISPIDVSDSFINNLKREKRMKRKLQRAQKIYARDNDEILTIPASFHNQGPPFYLSEVGLFPEVQYPLTASDTWTTNYWNSLPSNNQDRFFKKDVFFTDRKKPSSDSFHVFKESPTAKNRISSKSDILERENNKKSSGAKSSKIVRQTSQGQKKNVHSFEPKDEHEIEKYLMKTPKLTEKKKTLHCIEQKNSEDENLENIKVDKTFSPKTNNTTEMKSVTKKSMSSIKEVISHFSKLITKLEQQSDKHKITSTTTSTNQLISFSPTNGTFNSANQKEEQETNVSTQNNLTKILQVETKISKENMEGPGDELNLVQSSDKTITSDEGAQTSVKTSEEKYDFPFSFTDYVLRNQLFEVLSDPKLSIVSLRNGIFKILEEIDSKSVEELDESPLTGINESTHMLPLIDDYLSADNLESLLPGRVISYLDTQNTPSENFNETILPCTKAVDSSAVIFKNVIDDGKSIDSRHSDNVCEDDSYIPDHFGTGSLAENLRNVIAEPSSSYSLIEDLSEIIRLLTVWNSHIDDSGENFHQTTEIDTIDGYVPITTQHTSEGVPKTAISYHSYEVISDSNMIYHSIKDETEYSCDIHKYNVTSHLNKDMNDCATEKIFKPNETEHSIKDVTSYSCENNHELNATDYSRDESANYSCEDNYKYNETQYSNENMADHTCEDIHNRYDTKDTEKHNITNYFSATIPDYSSNDLFKPNTTNYLSETLPYAIEHIPKANVEDSEEIIPELSGANYLNENFEIVSDSPTIYHIPFEKFTNATNDKFSTMPIDADDQAVNDKVNKDSIPTSHRDLSDTTPLSVSPSFTYEVNEEIPETELVTFEKLDKITSTETITDKEITSNDNIMADNLPVFTFDDVFQSLSDDSETPIEFVSTSLSSFDENILKLHNETETEMYENYLPTIPNRDTKTYDEVCPITGNESSENQCFMIDDAAYRNNSRNFPFNNNMTQLFGDKKNPDFYDFILYPEEYEYTEASENNDTRELNSDATLDFTDYTVLPEDTTFSEYSEENYIETLATTVNPFDQYDDVPEQNEESNFSEVSSKSNEIIQNVGNRYVTPDTTFEPNLKDMSSTDYTLLPDPKLSKYLDDNFEEEYVFRPLYERNVRPLLHRDVVQHHQR